MSAPIDLRAARLRAGRRQALTTDNTFREAGAVVDLAPVVRLKPLTGAHFRSLPAVGMPEREQALVFAELVLAVFLAVEQHVTLPAPNLPDLTPHTPNLADLTGPDLTVADSVDARAVAERQARQARRELGVSSGPVPHMVRLLEAHGVAVVRLDRPDLHRVDGFSHHGHRPLVLLNPAKRDKARSRFDAAHELGHLLMHRFTSPGAELVERQAHAFAAEFLAPADEIAADLPGRLDWTRLHLLKRRWGISLKALVYRAHTLGILKDGEYQRGLRRLAAWGYPEPGPLGPIETPVLLSRALTVLSGGNHGGVDQDGGNRGGGNRASRLGSGGAGRISHVGPDEPGRREHDVMIEVALDARLPVEMVRRIFRAAGSAEPELAGRPATLRTLPRQS